MKRIFIIASLFSILSLPSVFAQFEGTFGAGIHAGYGSEINSLGVGAHVHYYYTNEVRFAPSYTQFIEREGKGMWMVDADAHYILPVSVTASLYPIGGVHFSRLQNTRNTDWRLGANLGLGVQHDMGYRIRANYELKYQFIRDYSQVVFMAGFGFWF